MNQRDKGKASLVEFLRSIKFAGEQPRANSDACHTHFAGFQQRARTARQYSVEDSQLIRSAN
jgi:hypothetical protein